MPARALVTKQGSTADRRADRVVLTANPGTDHAESYEALLNPNRLRETINVEWNRLPVIGLDHEILHYGRTKSLEIPLSFYFSAYAAGRVFRAGDVETEVAEAEFLGASTVVPDSKIRHQAMDFANFLRSLCFPTRGGFRPPDVRVLWPNVFEIIGVASNVSFEYQKFDRTMTPIIYTADVTFLEVRLTRRFSEQVRKTGIGTDIPHTGSVNLTDF